MRLAEFTSKAAPGPGSVAAGRAAGLRAPPRSHLDPKTAKTKRPASNVAQLPLTEVIVTP